MKTRLILVGGFLGAGKTTLLEASARQMSKDGFNIGLITNDQAPQLVDTVFLSRNDQKVEEVSGSCFCCNLGGLMDAVDHFRFKENTDVIFAEPVGSCTDLSATIIQPIKDRMAKNLVISPLSVLVDPDRLSGILEAGTAGLHPSAAYILCKQLEEADIIVLSKSDMMTPEDLSELEKKVKKMYPSVTVYALSTKTGKGLFEWLDAVMSRSDAGRKIVDVDYDRYAEGEAVLGWLNASIKLKGQSIDWKVYATDLLKMMGHRFDSLGSSVGHVKLIVEDDGNCIVGNLTGSAETLSIRGELMNCPTVRLILNARVEMAPEELDRITWEMLESSCKGYITMMKVAWQCLSPGRPNPTKRYDYIVNTQGD